MRQKYTSYQYSFPKIRKTSVRGFTLIELLVVVVTMALLFSVGYANYRSFQKRQRVGAVTREIKAQLRLLQEKSIAGVKPTTDPAVCSTLDGWGFSAAPGSVGPCSPFLNGCYLIAVRCDNTVGNDRWILSSKQIIKAPPGITIFIPLGGGGVDTTNGQILPIFFDVLGRGVRFRAGGNSITITITDVATVYQETIVVTKGGEIL